MSADAVDVQYIAKSMQTLVAAELLAQRVPKNNDDAPAMLRAVIEGNNNDACAHPWGRGSANWVLYVGGSRLAVLSTALLVMRQH